MDYFRSTQPDPFSATSQGSAKIKTVRGPQTALSLERADAPASSKVGQQQLDRVTVSLAAKGLAETHPNTHAVASAYLNLLQQAVKKNTLPIFPKATALAILRSEGFEPDMALSAEVQPSTAPEL